MGYLACALMLTAAPAHAQLSNLDDARFIQGLADRQMQDLLLHFLETADIKDPVMKDEIAVAQAKLLFENPNLNEAERAQGPLKVLEGYRKLINDHPLHYKRLEWKVDMVEYILMTVLPLRYRQADVFYEFGVPGAEQKQQFESLVAEAADTMKAANADWFILQGEIPRRKDFVEKFENTGIWRQMRDEIAGLKLPFYTAWINYYANLLPDANNKANRNVFEQRNAAGEKALHDLKEKQINQATIAQIESLRGRIRILQGKHKDAIKYLDRTLKMDVNFGLKFSAHLAKAKALFKDGDLDGAIAELEKLRETIRSNGVNNDVFRYVITYDAEHRFKMELAQAIKDEAKRKAKVNEAWDVFEQLKNDKALADAGLANVIAQFIDSRIVGDPDETLAEDKIKTEQPVKIMALVKAKLQEAGKLRETEPEKAKKYLNEVIDLVTVFIERDDLPDTMAAQSRFNLGLALFQLGKTYDASVAWVECAEKHPKVKISETAIAGASQLAYVIYRGNKSNKKVIDHMERCHSLLQEKFANIPQAKDNAYAYASFLREQERFDKAITIYDRVPQNFQFYHNAIFEQMICYYQVWERAEENVKASKANELLQAATDASDTLALAERDARDAARRKELKQFVGDTIAMQVEVLMSVGGANNMAKAQQLMQGFEQRFAEYPFLINQIQRLKIGNLIKRGNIQEADALIKEFVKKFPNQGGPMIRGVLDAIDKTVADLRDARKNDEADKLQAIGANMAGLLLNWAKQQPPFAGPALIPFQIEYGRQLIKAGKYAEAEKLFQQLYDTPAGKDNIDVVVLLGDSLYHQKKYDDANKHFRRIIQDVPDKTLPAVWHAWARMLQGLDAKHDAYMAEGKTEQAKTLSKEIYLATRRLQLEDPNYGEEFKSEFIKLNTKHIP